MAVIVVVPTDVDPPLVGIVAIEPIDIGAIAEASSESTLAYASARQ